MNRHEFWPTVCQLADAYADLGSTADERLAEAVATFRTLPPIVQRHAIACTLQLSNMPDLYAAIVAAANADSGRKSWSDSR